MKPDDSAAVSRRFWDRQSTPEVNSSTEGLGMLLRHPLLAELRRDEEEAIAGSLLALAPGMRVLDVGCGAGRWSFWFQRQAREVVGVDFSSRMIDACRQRAAACSTTAPQFLQRNAWEIDDLGTFDVIFAGGVLQYLDDEQLHRFIQASSAALRADGRILTRDSVLLARQDLAGDYPVHYRTASEYIERMRAAGFALAADERAYVFPQFVSKLPRWLPVPRAVLRPAVRIDGWMSTHPPLRWLWPVYRAVTGRGIGAVPDHRFFLYERLPTK